MQTKRKLEQILPELQVHKILGWNRHGKVIFSAISAWAEETLPFFEKSSEVDIL